MSPLNTFDFDSSFFVEISKENTLERIKSFNWNAPNEELKQRVIQLYIYLINIGSKIYTKRNTKSYLPIYIKLKTSIIRISFFELVESKKGHCNLAITLPFTGGFFIENSICSCVFFDFIRTFSCAGNKKDFNSFCKNNDDDIVAVVIKNMDLFF